MYSNNSLYIGNHQFHTCKDIASFLNGSVSSPNNRTPERNLYWDKFDMHNRIVRQQEFRLGTTHTLQDIIDAEIDLAKLNVLENIKYTPFTSTGSSILNSLILSYEEHPSLVIKTFQQYLRDCNAWTNLLTPPDIEFQQYNITTHQRNYYDNGKAEIRGNGGRRNSFNKFFKNNELTLQQLGIHKHGNSFCFPLSETYYLFYFYQITQQKQSFATLYDLANPVNYTNDVDYFLFPYRINKLISLNKLQYTLHFYDFTFSEESSLLTLIEEFFPASKKHIEIVTFIKNTFFDPEFLTSYFISDWPDCPTIIIDEVLSWFRTHHSGFYDRKLLLDNNDQRLLSNYFQKPLLNYAQKTLLNLRTELLEAFSTSFYSIISPKIDVQLIQDLQEHHFEIESLEKCLCNRLSNNAYFTSYYWSTYPLSKLHNGTRSHKHILDLYQNFLRKR